MVRVDGADLSECRAQLGGTVGDVEGVIASVELGLDLDQLAIPRDAVGNRFDKRITFAKDLQERFDLLRLQRAVEIDFTFGLGSF